MRQVAFVTSRANPLITEDDQILADTLAKHDITCEGAAWDDEDIDWASYELIIIRSTWNYHLKPDLFERWVRRVGTLSRVLNAPEIVLWNMNKAYLKELSLKNIAIPETRWIDKMDFSASKLREILSDTRWKSAVLKPCVSASSFHTNRIDAAMLPEAGAPLPFEFVDGGMMLQELMEEVAHVGELSLMFFDGQFSHAVLKKAKSGEFRVQHQFGGTATRFDVGEDVISAAAKILSTLPTTPLYARVDGVMVGDTFTLMELELIEPALFMRHAPADVLEGLASRISNLFQRV